MADRVGRSEAIDSRLVWMKAKYVRVGDQVLGQHSLLRVTHSQEAENGTWMLRSDWGVTYYHPEAPVAAMT